MSSVTSIVLITSSYEGQCAVDAVERLNSWLAENYDGTVLTRVDHVPDGAKALQCCIFLAAVNYLGRDDFLEVFRAIQWENPDAVQLLLKGEHDECFTLYTPNDPEPKKREDAP